MKLTTKVKASVYHHAYRAMLASIADDEAKYEKHRRVLQGILKKLSKLDEASAKLICVHAFGQAEKDSKKS